jgi:hypothetical protein
MSARLARLVLPAVVAGLSILPAAADAGVPIYSLQPAASSSQAGAHANVILRVELGARGVTEPVKMPCGCNAIRDLKVNTPAGLIAVPMNVPQCTAAEFAIKRCPVDSQLGLTVLRFRPDDQGGNYNFMPLYNMQAGEDKLALLSTLAPGAEAPIYTDITARTESDYGLEFRSFGIPSIAPPNLIATIFWGVPADPVHDALRIPFEGVFSPGDPNPHKTFHCDNAYNPIPQLLEDLNPANFGYCGGAGWPPVAANSSVAPFVQNPTACLGDTLFTADTFAYDLESDHAEAPYPAVTGCDRLSFDPTLSAKPTTTEADSPSGLDVNVTVPQTLSPTTPTSSAIREATVTLPEGFTITPNAADGKVACTAAQARFGTRLEAQCPEHAKIGTLEIESTQFPAGLRGAMYLGEPLPGNRYRIFWAFDGFSLHAKLAGTVSPDPQTGRLAATFSDLPQFNFQDFNLHFFGAERGILATPAQCGLYPVNAEFVPWAYPAIPKQTSTQFFAIDSGPGGTPCPAGARPFDPSFDGGVADNTAGRHSTLAVDISRRDGDQFLSGVKIVTPPGFSATLRGIPYCPEPAIDRLRNSLYSGLDELGMPACPPASRVGTVVAGAGAGTNPLHVEGRVYWAGPYRGAPLSLVVVTPAVSGPYDLGNVLVRIALHVDSSTARVTAISDPLPRILEGIPLRARRILVKLDRPGFTLNPTNCDPFSLTGQISGEEGGVVERAAHFQVANCATLPYQPELSLRLTDGLNRRGHPAVHAVFRARQGEANSSRVSVTLPPGELLDNAHIGGVCTRVAFAADSCPARSRIGNARVTTPLLDDPLVGGAYLRSSSHELPDIAIDLEGQVNFELVGHVNSIKGRLRAIFDSVPDIPVGTFKLNLLGGGKGLLQNSESLCLQPKYATARLRGQNGVALARRVPLEVACGERHRAGGAPRSGS